MQSVIWNAKFIGLSCGSALLQYPNRTIIQIDTNEMTQWFGLHNRDVTYKMFKMYLKEIFLFLFFVHSLSSLAETPRPPEVNRYFSENGKYMLIVHPTNKKINNKKSEEVKIQCHAILFQVNENDTIKYGKKN